MLKTININWVFLFLFLVAETENISDPNAYALRVDISMSIDALLNGSLVSLLLRIYHN